MVKSISKISFLLVFLVSLSIQSSISFEMRNQGSSQQESSSPQISPDYGKIPLYFIPNEGQVNEKALFYAKASRYTLWLTEEGLVFDTIKRKKRGENQTRLRHPKDKNNPEGLICERDASTLVFLNSKKNPEVVPEGQTEHKVNYFLGKDNSKWRTNIQTSRAVLYKELYQNIDLRIYGIERQIEYDFIVRPGGEVSDISFEYRDAIKTEIDKNGNLIVETKFGELEHEKPKCYQVIGEEKVEVKARFKKLENNTYSFKVKEYNRDYELIIDPLVLVYSTYLGGSYFDYGLSIAVDSEGAAYVTGNTWSTDFPIQNPIQGTTAGDIDAFIAKVSSSGDALVYSTYLGGSNGDASFGIAVDSAGAAYVIGDTHSWDFPLQNPIQDIYKIYDIFIAKVNSSGDALVYSTYLGDDSGSVRGRGIAVDSEGAAYVTGYTDFSDFPLQNPIQGTNAGGYDVFIAKVSSSGNALVYFTYLGGSDEDFGFGIAVDSEGAAYVTGSTLSFDFPIRNPYQNTNAEGYDVIIAKVNSAGDTLVYSTYLGGSDWDEGYSIAVDSEGAAYVTGYTSSSDFPLRKFIQRNRAGLEDVFIAKVSSSGDALVYSTYLGGLGRDKGSGIAVDSEGAAYVTGYTGGFPIHNPIQGNCGGEIDVFIAKVYSSGGALAYSTYLGGSNRDEGFGIAVDSEGAAYVTGNTYSNDFPIQNPIQENHAGYRDIIIAKVNFTDSTYSLTVNVGQGGTTAPSPGIYNYDGGTELTITAIPNSGYEFSGWSHDLSGTTNPITFTINSDKSLKANFETKPDGDGCFIATAAYGSPLHPYVEILRDFRDRYLMPLEIGRKIVELYYKYSPFVANIISKSKLLKLVVRINFTPFVVISYSMVHLGPINTGAILFLLILPIFLMSVLRRR